MAHTSAAHVPNLACIAFSVFVVIFTEERGTRRKERRWRNEIGGEKVTKVFIILRLLRPLKAI